MKGLFLLIVLSISLAAESTKCWKSLPLSTLGAIEIDLSEDLLLKLRQNTLLGKKVLTKKRLGAFVGVLEKHSLINPKLAAVLAELRSSGFTVDEMTKILNSRLGVALIPEKAGGQLYWSLVAWADMKGNLASKIISGLKEREHGTSSIVNGKEILRFKNDWESSFSVLSASGSCLLMVSSDLENKLKANAKQNNLNIMSEDVCLKRFNSFTANFLNSEAKGFLTKVGSSFSHKTKNYRGRRIVEYHLDLAKVFQLSEENRKKISLAGLDQIKMLSGFISLNDNLLQNKIFLETDPNRRSLLKLIDQPQVSVQADSWVSREINSYTHFAIDIQFIFDQIREMSSMQFGKAAVNNHLKALDTRSRAFLGADLKSIISSFGNKITFVDYGTDFEDVAGHIKPRLNTAMVIPFHNEAVTNRVIEIMTPFVEDKGIVRNDRLGFKGFQVNSKQFSGSLHIGHKKIILTLGKGVSDIVLKTVNDPHPDNLASSKEYKIFLSKLGQKNASMVTYGNLKRNFGQVYDLIDGLLNANSTFAGMEKRDKAFIHELLKHLPTKADILMAIGVAGAYSKPVANGLEINGFIELP